MLAKGNRWVDTSDPDKGGRAIIQDQHNMDGEVVTVIRHVNYMGNDGLNARIIKGLPLHRCKKNTREMFFKTVSSTTHGQRIKTVFALKFASDDDADDFEEMWYVKNGAIKALSEGENTLPFQETISANGNTNVTGDTNEDEVADNEANNLAIVQAMEHANLPPSGENKIYRHDQELQIAESLAGFPVPHWTTTDENVNANANENVNENEKAMSPGNNSEQLSNEVKVADIKYGVLIDRPINAIPGTSTRNARFSKRKASDQNICCFTPLRKKFKKAKPELDEKERLRPSELESVPEDSVQNESKVLKNTDSVADSSNDSANGSDTSDSDEGNEGVLIDCDYEDAPASQNWMSAFHEQLFD